MKNSIYLAILGAASLAGCANTQFHFDANSTPVAPAALQAPVGATWFKLPTEAYKGKQDDVFFVDAALGFYVNGQGKIYRTRDGGQRWDLVLHQPGTYFRAIAMENELHGFAGNIGVDYFPGVTDSQPLYETHNGGDTWMVVKHLPGAPVKGICAIDILKTKFVNAGELGVRTVVHAGGRVGSPASLLRSLDGGATWSQIDMSPWVAMIVDVKFFDAMNGIVFAGSDANLERSHALIVATHDGGVTWNKVYESTRLYELTWKGSFPTRDVGYATVQSYDPDPTITQRYVVKTVDGGRSWREMPLVNDAKVREFGVGFGTATLGWVGTSTGGFETQDGGLTWRKVELGRVVNKIRILPQGNSFRAYAIGADLYSFGIESQTDLSAGPTTGPVPVNKP